MNDESKDINDTCRLDGRQDMIVNTFYSIIDNISSELGHRSKIYFDRNEVFGVIYKLFTLENEEIREKAFILVQKYPTDLNSDLGEELVHFKAFATKAIDEKVKRQDYHLPAEFLKFIRQKQLITLFPNIDTALRILLCMMTTNSAGERSFSILKRVKNYLRNSRTDSRLSSLAGFAANAEILIAMDFDDIVKEFSSLKARKVHV